MKANKKYDRKKKKLLFGQWLRKVSMEQKFGMMNTKIAHRTFKELSVATSMHNNNELRVMKKDCFYSLCLSHVRTCTVYVQCFGGRYE